MKGKDRKVTFKGQELKDIDETTIKCDPDEGTSEQKKFYTFRDGLQILFISEKEFMQMKKIGKARFIKYADSDRIFLFDEDCIRHFFDDAETDELVAEIKSRAYERWLLAKEAVSTTSSFLGW